MLQANVGALEGGVGVWPEIRPGAAAGPLGKLAVQLLAGPDWVIYLDLEKRQSIIIIHTTVVEFMMNQEDIPCYCVRRAKSRSSIFLIAACVRLAFTKVKAGCRRGGLRCYIIQGNIQIILDCRYRDTIVYVLENLCTKTVINTSTSY